MGESYKLIFWRKKDGRASPKDWRARPRTERHWRAEWKKHFPFFIFFQRMHCTCVSPSLCVSESTCLRVYVSQSLCVSESIMVYDLEKHIWGGKHISWRTTNTAPEDIPELDVLRNWASSCLWSYSIAQGRTSFLLIETNQQQINRSEKNRNVFHKLRTGFEQSLIYSPHTIAIIPS